MATNYDLNYCTFKTEFDFRSGRATVQAVGQPVRFQGRHFGSVVDKLALGQAFLECLGYTSPPYSSVHHSRDWEIRGDVKQQTNKKRAFESQSLKPLPSADKHNTFLGCKSKRNRNRRK
jgi:hypothetical protein